jgi:hypothetical protein
MRTLLLIAAVVAVVSCNDHKTPVASSGNDSAAAALPQAPAGAVIPERKQTDTINELTDTTYSIGGYTLTFKKVDSMAIDDLNPVTKDGAPVEKVLSAAVKKKFKQSKNILTLFLENGKTLDLKDVENGEAIAFAFDDYLPSINHGLVQVVEGGESVEYSLVNFKNGKQKYIIGRPSVAASHKRIMAANEDMEASFSSNGFQLLTAQADSLVNNFTVETIGWAPIGIKWLSDNELVFKTDRQLSGGEYTRSYKTEYYKLTITNP